MTTVRLITISTDELRQLIREELAAVGNPNVVTECTTSWETPVSASRRLKIDTRAIYAALSEGRIAGAVKRPGRGGHDCWRIPATSADAWFSASGINQ